MSEIKKVPTNTVITGMGRLSFAFIWSPREQEDSDAKKYSTSFLVPKSDTETVKKLQAAIKEAQLQGMKKLWGGKLPSKLKMPIRDGDKEADDKGEEYRGHWFFNATSTIAPGIIDRSKQPITDQSEVYSGCFARISITLYPFDKKGSRGIACALNNIQKLKDGESLGGVREKAENEFDVWEDPAVGDLPFGDDDGDLPFGEDDSFEAA